MADRAAGERGRRVGPAELATRRVIAVGAAVIALVVSAAAALLVVREDDRGLPVWFVALGAVAVTVFILTGALAPWLRPRALRVAAGAAACGYLLQLVAFLPAHQALPQMERMPWILSASTAAVAASLIAFGQRGAWTVLALAALGTIGHRAVVGGLDLDGIVNDTQATLAGTVVCVVGAHVLETARALDEAAAAASETTARAASERGRLAARTRAAALVHDEVLATLTLAASDLPVPADRLAGQAVRASQLVVELATDGPPGPSLIVALREEARRAGAVFADARTADAVVPPLVVSALVAAARQALANSLRHAGAATRRVELGGDAERVRVRVLDDGAGFDPEAVGADRLGVRSSIVSRMRAVSGGSARVDSAPGQGTQVVLEWAPRLPETSLPAPAALHAGLLAIAVVFVVGQALSAIAAAVTTSPWWVPVVELAGVLVAAEVLRFSVRAVPTIARTAVFLAVVAGAVAGGLLFAPFAFGPLWFTASASFLLVALVLRGRPMFALAGMVSLVLVLVCAGIGVGASGAEIGYIVARPIVLVTLAVALLASIERMQERTRALHRRTLAGAREAAWDAARRAELTARAAELDARVLPLLRRIARGTPLDTAERGACVALEGELRDEYRAGSLAREPLTGTVRGLRARGVDVVLLDDADEPPEGALADAIAVWMAERIATARGRVVGRLLPSGRAERARVTVDGETTGFRG